MKISTKGWLASSTILLTICFIAADVWWANEEVEQADKQHRETIDISRGLTLDRQMTFEYHLNHSERARAQGMLVSDRVDRLIADIAFSDPTQQAILIRLRNSRVLARRVASDIFSATAGAREGYPIDDPSQQLEAQLLRQLLLVQRDNYTDTFLLTDLANGRIVIAQRRMTALILLGLVLIGLLTIAATLLIQRQVLMPILRLRQATGEIAKGNWSFRLGAGRNDEIGDMSRNFDTMTQTLRDAFTQIEHNNLELDELNQELEAFSYSVSHDLRAPLRTMDGFSLALLEDYGKLLDDEGRDDLARIRAAAQRMGRLIDDLLRLSRVTRADLKVQEVDLSAMTSEIALVFDQTQPERHVQWQIEPGLKIHADRALIQIVMQNLLDNAWKFTAKTARPMIRVGKVEHEGRPTFFIADNGAGFDMTHAERLFGAFQRMHHTDDFPGTGIGLAIVQRIIRRHEGKIWAEAQVGQGATFFFNVKEAEK